VCVACEIVQCWLHSNPWLKMMCSLRPDKGFNSVCYARVLVSKEYAWYFKPLFEIQI